MYKQNGILHMLDRNRMIKVFYTQFKRLKELHFWGSLRVKYFKCMNIYNPSFSFLKYSCPLENTLKILAGRFLKFLSIDAIV